MDHHRVKPTNIRSNLSLQSGLGINLFKMSPQNFVFIAVLISSLIFVLIVIILTPDVYAAAPDGTGLTARVNE